MGWLKLIFGSKYTLAVALLALAAWAVWLGVDQIADSALEQGKAEQKAAGLARQVDQRDALLEGWESRYDALQAQQRADDAALAQRQAELVRLRRRLAETEEEYEDAMRKLDKSDQKCAMRTVPGPVDSLLGTGASGTAEPAENR